MSALAPSTANLSGNVHVSDLLLFCVRLLIEDGLPRSIARRCVHMLAQHIETGLVTVALMPVTDPTDVTKRTLARRQVRTIGIYRLFMVNKARGIITSATGNMTGFHDAQSKERGAGSDAL
jgi:hypothetical protein